MNAALDQHPSELDRDKYLKRALAMQLLARDELEVAFREKAIVDRDVAAGALLVKVAERRAGADQSFTLDVVAPVATPLPAALPLFATGLGALGLLGWRRKRKSSAAVA